MTPVLAGYAVAVALLSPYLYYMFAFAHARGSVLDPVLFGADLLSFVIPTAVNELGRPSPIAAIASTYMASLTETTSYLALPLIAIAVLFASARFREPVGRILIELLLILCLLALGSRVVIAGHPTIAAPWTLLLQFPLLNKIVPIRLMAYAFLALAKSSRCGSPRPTCARYIDGYWAWRWCRSCCLICRRDSGKFRSISRPSSRPVSIGNTGTR